MLRLSKSAEYEPDVRVDDHDASRPMESDAGSKPLLDKITIVGDFESIENDWRHFESYADCTPFQTFDWLATWNRCIGIHAVSPAGILILTMA